MREELLGMVRAACEGLADWQETVKWGEDRVFQTGKKMFAIVGEWKGDLILSVKVGKEAMGVFDGDERYFPAPYLARAGWIALKAGGRTDREEVSELVRGSYGLITGSKAGRRSH